MSSAEEAARHLPGLEPEDLKVLRGLEKSLRSHEFTFESDLTQITKLPAPEVIYRIGRLNLMGFVFRGEGGFTLVSSGLDALALSAFVKRGLIVGLEGAIGMGKESDVYRAVAGSGEVNAIKFFRIGRISFRATRRKRQYTEPGHQHRWLQVNIEAAKKEFDALKCLFSAGAPVPEPLARERHAVLMKLVEGVRLTETGELEDPDGVLRKILEGVRIAYLKVGLVNGDLSEFNVLVDSQRIWIIDWPQVMPTSHPVSNKLLERDLLNILNFFRRKFRVTCTLQDASFYVRGWRQNIPLFKS